jgi:hypothetical protein
MDDLRYINPRARPGELHHEDEAALLAALWLRRRRLVVDLATMRDLKTRFGITTAQAVEAVRLRDGAGHG